ncbi:ankyrin repeat domain-containing protein [Purpureocillium lilacinum]|uniref:Ankyrin repeat domain-containing protein n=1 Tax=Purpureocillium lilacinum TaxID=33203 RepID=A0A179F785_PURLI|nr:ankyrin repeat domain-containing protein [Purpureocillium lilacinum]OAQ61288.1 ankyrin repeat domain-containing protein [Purpureocillium lilacinum]
MSYGLHDLPHDDTRSNLLDCPTSTGPPPSGLAKESFFDLREALGLPLSASTTSVATGSVRDTPSPIHQPQEQQQQPEFKDNTSSHSWPLPRTTDQQQVPHQLVAAPSFLRHRANNMAHSSKAGTECLQLCSNTAAAADRVAESMAECTTLVKHLPHGFDVLANDLLDTCEVLFLIEAGLADAVRQGQSAPLDMIAVLDKKLRMALSQFRALDQILQKRLDYERKGSIGRMKRGFGRMFGERGLEKFTTSLVKIREDLKMSAYMFHWNVTAEKVEGELGIGYIGLLSALEDLDLRRKRAGSIASEDAHKGQTTYARPPGLATTQGGIGQSRLPVVYQGALSFQPTPHSGVERSVLLSHESSLSGESSNFAHSSVHQGSPLTLYTNPSTTGFSNGNIEQPLKRRKPGAGAAALGLSASRETPETSLELEALVEDVELLDLDSPKISYVKSEPFTMPRRRPRNNIDEDKAGSHEALVGAVCANDHRLLTQLLDRGVSPMSGAASSHALNKAIVSHNGEALRLLLLYGADPNETDRHDGVCPLVAAVKNSFMSAAVALLKYGADPNLSAGPDSETPLSVAVAADNVRLTHLLLMYGGNAKQMTAAGSTLLVKPMDKKTSKTVVDMLLSSGADPDGKNREGKTALFEAITAGRADIVNSLLEGGANANLPGPKHMLWPSMYHPACLKLVLAHGADYKKAPGVMELAASINNIESIRILLEAGVDPNAKKDGIYTPLCTAIRDNRSEIFKLLLSHGADPNVPASEYPAFKCITHNRVHFLPALVAAGANLASPRGILETAVSSNNSEAMRWLLDQGLDPDDKSPTGRTALTSAIRDNRVELVDELLRRGANPNIRGQDWPVCMAVRNPDMLRRILAVLPEPRAFKGLMERAVMANQLESVKLLLAAGVSVEDRNGGVFSPLTTAIREGRRDIVAFLITEGGADVNAPGEHLPIVKALRRRQEGAAGIDEILDMLVDKGADPNKMYRGWNGIMQALENGDAAVLQKLCKCCGVDLSVKDELGRTVTEIAVSRRWEEAANILASSN